MDANLMHISFESGVLENPAGVPPEGIYKMTVDPEVAAEQPETITIEFHKGNAAYPELHQNSQPYQDLVSQAYPQAMSTATGLLQPNHLILQSIRDSPIIL